MAKWMRAARLHAVGEPFQLDTIPVPDVRPTDVLVEVRAAGIVPDLRDVVKRCEERMALLTLPPLPTICGLDAAGVVAVVGSQVRSGIKPGDSVYVNPGLSCGACTACRRGDPSHCSAYTLLGCCGFGPGSRQIQADYPYGAFGHYLTAPAANLVKLNSSISFEQGARFGALGTAYAALRKAQFAPGQTVLVDGGIGTLGVGAVMLALAMGAAKVFASGRDRALLKRLQGIDAQRVVPIVLGTRPTADVVKEATGGEGVDASIEVLAPGAPASMVLDAFAALRTGGKAIHVGRVAGPISIEPLPLVRQQKSCIGSLWFTPSEGQDVADMAHAGTLDLGVFEHEHFPLENVNEALDAIEQRAGGFTNVVIIH